MLLGVCFVYLYAPTISSAVYVYAAGIKSYTSVYNLQGEAQNKGKEHSVGLMAVLAASSLGTSISQSLPSGVLTNLLFLAGDGR